MAVAAMVATGCSDMIKKENLDSTSVVCLKPDGKHYGLPEGSKCVALAVETKSRPDTGFLGLQNNGKAVNYDTAKSQGDAKTKLKKEADRRREIAISMEKTKREEKEKERRERQEQIKIEANARAKAENAIKETVKSYQESMAKYGATKAQIKFEIDSYLSDDLALTDEIGGGLSFLPRC
ncbi:hypothetical protein KBY72_13940 [Cyanobium sp. BA5m-21]|nr:hypothetical protein [Cyanobium sp. BA5m-21]